MIYNLEAPTDRGSFKTLIQQHKDKLIIVKCSATWCCPCRKIVPFFNKYMNELGRTRSIIYIHLDFDRDRDIISHLRVKSVPTILSFKDGYQQSSFIGSDDKKLEQWFSQV